MAALVGRSAKSGQMCQAPAITVQERVAAIERSSHVASEARGAGAWGEKRVLCRLCRRGSKRGKQCYRQLFCPLLAEEVTIICPELQILAACF